MPAMVKLAANPAYVPSGPEDKKLWEALKKAAPMNVDYTTAMENIVLSNGLYALVPTEVGSTQVPAPRRLEDMDDGELKLALASFGVALTKSMTRADAIGAIRAKMDEMAFADDASKP